MIIIICHHDDRHLSPPDNLHHHHQSSYIKPSYMTDKKRIDRKKKIKRQSRSVPFCFCSIRIAETLNCQLTRHGDVVGFVIVCLVVVVGLGVVVVVVVLVLPLIFPFLFINFLFILCSPIHRLCQVFIRKTPIDEIPPVLEILGPLVVVVDVVGVFPHIACQNRLPPV